jgi:hypothetical protein
VTFKEVQNLLETQPDYSTSQQSKMLQRCRGKPYWIWNSASHKNKTSNWPKDCSS